MTSHSEVVGKCLNGHTVTVSFPVSVAGLVSFMVSGYCNECGKKTFIQKGMDGVVVGAGVKQA